MVSPLEVARGANGGRSHEGRAVLAPQVAKKKLRGGVAGGAVATRLDPFGLYRGQGIGGLAGAPGGCGLTATT